MRYLFPILFLAGCSDFANAPNKYGDCLESSGAYKAFGTPDNLGPCVGIIEHQTVGYGDQTVLTFRHTTSGRYVVVHWVGDKIISISA